MSGTLHKRIEGQKTSIAKRTEKESAVWAARGCLTAVKNDFWMSSKHDGWRTLQVMLPDDLWLSSSYGESKKTGRRRQKKR